jgi:hypothetical protein
MQVKYKNFSSPFIHLVRGPAEVTLLGTCQVLGKDVSNNKVSIAAGKIYHSKLIAIPKSISN